MVILALLAVSLVPLVALLTIANVMRRRESRLGLAVVGLTLVHELMLVVYPVWYSIFTDFQADGQKLVTPGALLRVVIGEALFVAVFAVVVLWGQALRNRPRRTAQRHTDGPWLVYPLVVFGVIYQAILLTAPVESFDALTQHAELVVFDSSPDMLWGWAKGAFAFPALIAAAIVLTHEFRRKVLPITMRFASIFVLVAQAVVGISSGVRGRLAWVASLLIVTALLRRKWRIVYIALAAACLLVPLSPFLGGGYRSIYYSELAGSNRGEALTRMAEVFFGSRSDDLAGRGVLGDWSYRAQGPRNSAILYDLFDRGEAAGFAPLASALYAPIPRVVWPDKRPAGSIDNTPYGAAIFLVERLSGAPVYNMGPILTSAHAYWEGGWPALILQAVLLGVFWIAVLEWSERSSSDVRLIVCLTFAAALLIDGLLTAMQPTYAIIIKFWSSVLPLLLLNWLLLWASRFYSFDRVAPRQPYRAFQRASRITESHVGHQGRLARRDRVVSENFPSI